MPKITEYPKASAFDTHDVLLKDGANGTKKIEIEDFIADVSNTTNGTNGKLAKASDVDNLKNIIYDSSEKKSVDGPIISFLDGTGSSELIYLKEWVGPSQLGSGDPSSSNVRPFEKRTQQTAAFTPRNLFRLRSSSQKTSGITVTPKSDGTLSYSGTSTGGGPVAAYVYLVEGVKYYCQAEYSSGNYYPRLDGPNGERVYPQDGLTFTAPSTGEYTFRIYVNSGKSFNKTSVIPYVCLDNSNHTKCPATGKAIALPITQDYGLIYSGILEYEAGGNYKIHVFPHYDSYNGETLTGLWASSMDVYTEGATPTIGAEVIDLSGTVTETYTYTGNKITIFDGENVIATSMKYGYLMSVTYIANGVLAEDNSYDIPSYYRMNNYMDDKIAAVRAAILESGGNYDSFIFITDTHWASNAKTSPALIKYILDRLPIPRVFFGGDLGEGINLNCLHAYREKIDAKIYNTIGNHEYHDYYYELGKPSTSMTMKDAYLWAYFNGGMTDAVLGNAGRNYYYVDNTVQKIRYIILNVYAEGTVATFESDQQNWLANTALDLPSGYTAVIIAHQVAYVNHNTGALNFSYGAAGTAIRDIVDAASATTEIACVFCGHTHFDGVGTTPGGVPVIVTTCDKYKPVESYDDWLTERRLKGTITEQAFDVCVLDKTNKKITAVRIGCPADNPAGSPLETRTVTYGTA